MQTRPAFDVRAFLPSLQAHRAPSGRLPAPPAKQTRPQPLTARAPQPRDPRPHAPSQPVPTAPQRALLVAVDGAGPQGASVSQLASACGNMPQVLGRCLERGWVLRTDNPDTPGARVVRLSEAGATALSAAARG